MRLFPLLLLALPMFALQAHAQTSPPPAPAKPATAQAASSAPAPAPQQHAHRVGWKQRFAEANTTHDGHLTLQQAEAGYRTVARHFAQIDVDKKGYVTVEDIDTWHKLQHALRHPTKSQGDDSLLPRPAIQRSIMPQREINTSAATKLAPMSPTDPPPAVTAPTQGNVAAAPGDTTITQPHHGT